MEEGGRFQGIMPPAITVFDSEGGIDAGKTKRFLQHLIDSGVHGLFVAGSTGEYSLMTMEQRRQIIDVGVEAANGKVPLFAGTGHNSTRIAVELSKYAEVAGADGVVASLPHYPRPTQEALYRHYQAISEAIDIPLYVYSWPGQYVVDIEPETVARLAADGYVQGIKDSTHDVDHTAKIVKLTGGRIVVLEGFETKIFAALCLGADGAICTMGNILPAELVAIYELFREGKMTEAREKQMSVFGLAEVLSAREDMQLLKEGLKMLGLDVGDALMPTSEVPPELKERLRAELVKLGKLR
jgi:4-hydroxy-tetrahydrodipicolinate synthase